MASSEQFEELRACAEDTIARAVKAKIFAVVIAIDAIDNHMMLAASHRGDGFYEALELAVRAFKQGDTRGLVKSHELPKDSN